MIRLTREQNRQVAREVAANHRSKDYPQGLDEGYALERVYKATAVLRLSPTLRNIVVEDNLRELASTMQWK